MTIRFVVSGQPVPKQRPCLGGRGQVYTPPKTVQWEQQVGWQCRIAMSHTDPIDGDVSITMCFYRSGRRKVDLDNLVKSVSDGLNGVAYLDDNQVVELHAYLFKGQDNPRVEVVITRVE